MSTLTDSLMRMLLKTPAKRPTEARYFVVRPLPAVNTATTTLSATTTLVALTLAAVMALVAGTSSVARADYDQRLSLGAGIVSINKPTTSTYFELTGEYEYRFDPIVGVGVGANYIFSNPSITMVAVPDLFFHPLGGEWIINAAPLLEFRNNVTYGGSRVGMRVPIPLGIVTLLPSVAIDFIRGGREVIFGLGIEF